MIGLRAIIARPTLIINEPSLGKFFTRQELQKFDDLATFRNLSLEQMGLGKEQLQYLKRLGILGDQTIRSKDAVHLVMGEMHEPRTGQMIRKPTWLLIPEKGLYTTVFITGAMGSGKTADVMYPLLDQLVGFSAQDATRKAAGLILDAKGDSITQTQRYLSKNTTASMI